MGKDAYVWANSRRVIICYSVIRLYACTSIGRKVTVLHSGLANDNEVVCAFSSIPL
jgi:hypothetical protein